MRPVLRGLKSAASLIHVKGFHGVPAYLFLENRDGQAQGDTRRESEFHHRQNARRKFMMFSNCAVRAASRAATLCLLFVIGGCFGTQIYPTLEQRIISLKAGELEASGVAFITPSTATGQEEEKQAAALIFAEVLKRDRPKIRVVTLAETLGAVNKAGLAETYKGMYEDYRDTGLFARDALRQISKVTGARYIAQLKLQQFNQGDKERFGILGLRIVETRYAGIRLFFQIWDSRDGTIAWESTQETQYSHDTVRESPVTFRTVLERTAKDLIAILP